MAHTEQWLPLGSSDLEFDVNVEMRRATVDLLRHHKPRTVLGALLAYEQGLPVDELAELLDKPVGEVEFTVERLEEEDLCERIMHDGIIRVVGFAAFSTQNAV